MAQECIALAGSTQCPAFESASFSTGSAVVGLFPFLQFVSDTSSFDRQLRDYVSTAYVQSKYQTLLGCGGVSLTNTSNLYARYTTSVICNAIIQNSRSPCGLSDAEARPLCADTCAQYASSEAIIAADESLCRDPGADLESQIRADFTNCALPANALSGTCINGSENESNDCGFANSTIGFCQYCGAGGQNSTDTCCYNSKAELRCANVVLPTLTSYMTFGPTETPTSTGPADTPTDTAAETSNSDDGLSGGAIAGIVIGSLAGVAVLIGLVALLFLCCRRRRRGSQNGSVLNQPTPPRKGAPQMIQHPVGEPQATPEGYEVLPGGRIARMSALEGHSNGKDGNGTALAAAGIAGYAAGARRNHEPSSSDEYESPGSNKAGILRPPPTTRRNGSLSSGSALGNEEFSSPRSADNGMSSPQGMASQQSEQLASFKDYYSPEEIHPGDKVATLWGYQPRAGDEFALERGDMLKVVGIWDDAWATGVLLKDRAEDWDIAHNSHRDSGVSNTSEAEQGTPAPSGEIKAFPLVCVCLPDHWQKTIEGEASTETGSSVPGMPI